MRKCNKERKYIKSCRRVLSCKCCRHAFPLTSCGLLEIQDTEEFIALCLEVFVCVLLSFYQDIFFLIYRDSFFFFLNLALFLIFGPINIYFSGVA